MRIRKFKVGDEEAISKLHNGTIREINGKDYSQEEIESWSPIRTSYERMRTSLEKNTSYVAVIDNQIAGFGDLNSEGHVKRLYTHKDFQGKGVGSAILSKLEEEAKKLGFKKITLESTITAKTFYESKGYICLGKKIMESKRVEHEDWEMKKSLK